MFGLVQDIDGRYPLTPIRFVLKVIIFVESVP